MRVDRRLALFMLAFGALGICFALNLRHSKQGGSGQSASGAVPVLSLAPPIDPYTIFWLDNHTLLLSRSINNTTTCLFTHNIDTGRELQIQGFAGYPQQISPDRTRLLWQDGGMPFLSGGEQLPKDFDTRTAIHVDLWRGIPAKIRTWKQQKPANALLWLHDSHHFMEINAASSAILVHDCLHPSVIQTLKPEQAHDLDAIGGLVQVTQGNKLVCTSAFHGPEPVVANADIFVLPILQGVGRGMSLGHLQHYIVKFPPYAHIWGNGGSAGIAFSPRGDKIAWWLKFDDDVPLSLSGPAVQPLIRTGPGSIVPRGENRAEAPLWLWVCSIDGTDMHSLGKLGTDFSSGSSSYDNSGVNLQWLPDSRRLSFQYRDSLWVVPAE